MTHPCLLRLLLRTCVRDNYVQSSRRPPDIIYGLDVGFSVTGDEGYELYFLGEAAGESKEIGGLGGVARAGEHDGVIAQSKNASQDDA